MKEGNKLREIRYTKEQQEAVDAAHGNLLISAAAGSGKTAVLTGRVIRLLAGEQPISANRLVIVTFTVAAAAGMRRRIEQALAQRIEQEPDNAFLQSQQLMLSGARISTIHALCTDLIRQNAHRLGIAEDFRIEEQEQLAALKQDLLNGVLDGCYEEANPDFLSLVNDYATQSDAPIVEMVQRMYEFIRCYPFPLTYLDRFLAMYQGEKPFLETLWGAEIKQYLHELFADLEAQLSWALEQIESDEQLAPKYFAPVQHDRDTVTQLRNILEGEEPIGEGTAWDAMQLVLRHYEKQRLGAVRKYENKEFQEQIKLAREEATKQLLKLQTGMFEVSEAEIQADHRHLHARMAALFEVVRRYDQALFAEKKRRGVLEFSDLEHLTLQLLATPIPADAGGADAGGEGASGGRLPDTGTAAATDRVAATDSSVATGYQKTDLAVELSETIDEIMIDECQDINRIQNVIFWAMSRGEERRCLSDEELLLQGENLFLVGDAKQSIYRFRNAMPALFIRRSESFPLYTEQTPPKTSAKILLQRNFRSRSSVTESVNRVFSALMSHELGEICYGEEERLIPAATYLEAPNTQTELHLIDYDPTSCLDATGRTEPKVSCEARYVAERIRRMIATGYLVQDERGGEVSLRRCTPRDFCILLRANQNKTSVYLRELTRAGIPCHGAESEGVLESFEVSTMVHLLRVLDHPMLDLSLFAVLTSPLFGFSFDALAEIRLKDRKASLHTALSLAAADGDVGCQTVLERLSAWRHQGTMLPIASLLRLLYEETGFYTMVGAMAFGSKKRAHLNLLLFYAEQYQQRSLRGLSGFLRYLDQMIAQGGGQSMKQQASDRADVVQVMTIHASKGLEFPICVVADLGKQFYQQDLFDKLLLHEQYGCGMEIYKRETLQKYAPPQREAIRLALLRETLSEEMRVLYVAMTRAKEKLILTGLQPKMGEFLTKTLARSVGGSVSPQLLLRKKSYLEWLLLALSSEADLSGLNAARLASDGAVSGAGETPAEEVSLTALGVKCVLAAVPPLDIVEEQANTFQALSDPAIATQLASMHQVRYPYALQTKLPAKRSVTQLTKGVQGDVKEHLATWELSRQSSERDPRSRFTGAERGSILHHFLQYANFDSLCSEAALEAEIARLVAAAFFTPLEAKVLNRRKILQFGQSDILSQMKAAGEGSCYREYPFFYEMLPKDLPESDTLPSFEQRAGCAEKILVQGIADAILVQEDGLVIIDYKTDVLPDEAAFLLRYRPQLLLYREALAAYFGRPVKRCLLYSLHLGREITVA